MSYTNSGRRARRKPNQQTVADNHVLEELRQKFSEFRRQEKRFTRIPEALRQSVFDVLDRGITPAEVRRNCGVTAKQLDQWQKEWQRSSRNSHGGAKTSKPASAECFTVVHTGDDNITCANTERAVALELRVGSWAITICGLSD